LIRTENYEINGVAFVRTYSDANRYVVRDGVSYDEANDPASLGRTYTEGDEIREEEEAEPDQIVENLLADGVIELPPVDEPDFFNESEPEPDYFA
jgi:hypothetical protein